MAVEGVFDKITLEKIDTLRERANISYRRAYEILESVDGDLVKALIQLEEEPRSWTERFQVSGSELVTRVRELIREGNVNRITIRSKERVLLDIPVTIGAIGAVLMPYLAALGVIAALATRCTIEVERRNRVPGSDGASGAMGSLGDGGYVGYTGAGRVPEAGRTPEAVGTAGAAEALTDFTSPTITAPAPAPTVTAREREREGRLRRPPRKP